MLQVTCHYKLVVIRSHQAKESLLKNVGINRVKIEKLHFQLLKSNTTKVIGVSLSIRHFHHFERVFA
jgi:hypothetical protein